VSGTVQYAVIHGTYTTLVAGGTRLLGSIDDVAISRHVDVRTSDMVWWARTAAKIRAAMNG
jgi:hypothetical protein